MVRIGLSPVSAPGVPPRRWTPDNCGLFPDICAKAENGFVAAEICFIGPAGRNIDENNSMIS
ncbi:MAG: hypothetical protein K2X57_20080, partial [Xanthobacteraceae bacterium]|nr:hypothetical protein [Xanthobacteraceae bacterium]